MVRMIQLTEDEAINYIRKQKCNIFLMVSEDMSRNVFLGRKYINKQVGVELIRESKTVVLNEDKDKDDSFSLMSLFVDSQPDILNLIPKGKKHDIIFVGQSI